MKNSTSLALGVVFIAAAASAVFAQSATPRGWTLGGSKPEGYTVQTGAEKHEGSNVISLRATGMPDGFGALMQTIQSDNYRGRRVRLSGYVKSQGVSHWCGLWMRVEGSDGKVLAFDNMQRRPVQGDSPWKKYDVVMDVPQESALITFGALLFGPGQAWISGLSFQIVDKDTPVTATFNAAQYPKEPANLELE